MKNPVYDFYNLLREMVVIGTYGPAGNQVARYEAEMAVKIYETYRNQISLPGVTVESLMLWHEQIYLGEKLGDRQLRVITSHLFSDLSSQMRNSRVRHLFTWMVNSITEGLGTKTVFACVRKEKSLGDGITAFTIVTNDHMWLRNLPNLVAVKF